MSDLIEKLGNPFTNVNFLVPLIIATIPILIKFFYTLFKIQEYHSTEIKLLPMTERANILLTEIIGFIILLIITGFIATMDIMHPSFSNITIVILWTFIFGFLFAIIESIFLIIVWGIIWIITRIKGKKPKHNMKTIIYDKNNTMIGELLNRTDENLISVAQSADWNCITFIKYEDIPNKYWFDKIPKEEINYPKKSYQEKAKAI